MCLRDGPHYHFIRQVCGPPLPYTPPPSPKPSTNTAMHVAHSQIKHSCTITIYTIQTFSFWFCSTLLYLSNSGSRILCRKIACYSTTFPLIFTNFFDIDLISLIRPKGQVFYLTSQKIIQFFVVWRRKSLDLVKYAAAAVTL